VVGAGARIGAFNELAAGARVWPEVELPDRAIRFSTDA
jgi:mannose-1-phosphate guanylyltransferase